jgi:hypothetical protein
MMSNKIARQGKKAHLKRAKMMLGYNPDESVYETDKGELLVSYEHFMHTFLVTPRRDKRIDE